MARGGDTVLVMRRASGGSVVGLWEFSGGKLKRGENPREALGWKWAEETGLKFFVGDELVKGWFFH